MLHIKQLTIATGAIFAAITLAPAALASNGHDQQSKLAPTVQAHSDASQTWARLDANADGQLTPQELKAFRTRMLSRTDDIDPDGLDKAEFMSAWNDPHGGHHNTQQVKQLWNDMDADGSGVVSASEAAAFQHRVFARLDSNHNGSISKHEYLASLRKHDPYGKYVESIAGHSN